MADAEFDSVLENANLGAEPSDDYIEGLDVLDDVVRDCMLVSKGFAGIPAPTSRHFYASVLFTALISRAVSLVNLAPHSKWSEKVIEHWDYASATGIVRTMLEARLAFYYLCTDPCPEEEWEVRWNLFTLHDCMSRRRMFEALEQDEQVQAFEEQAEELRERLLSNPFFQTLAAGQQRKYLNGQSAYLMPMEDIAERAGVEKKFFRWIYVLLSSHVHCLPMSFYRMGMGDDQRGRGLPSPAEQGYTILCHSLATSLLGATRDEVCVLFEGMERQTPIVEELIEEKIAEAVAQPDKFAIGEMVELFKSEEIRLEVKRIDEEKIEATYYHEPYGAVVLRRVEAEDSEVELSDLDPFFWSIQANGKAVSEGMLSQIVQEPHVYKIDHTERSIKFKTVQ
ncbi:DUF5677 domain-containing protein [Oxalobacteraceae bacterium R-40]|uniref:DUF5677 domain-containing protein n=1 Tax=Keguizhuia sedimenti TaxID=3064264 RepID=A0ABU1BP50_9BURK|nr:DUF5677 domain-containing protein [Oxalobacteraceae bacterium R-40]